ncbi:MAG: hypothetical protein BGO96_05445 [Micrococcales bacterium 73-15]|uniref:hypothetical protein n=1 Tax=Salana multivorans TaxID=120377 RepID=UPI000966F167|nr:hypothetical protein [Salana multivorans]OJX97372.1 MAG: hypothetical protein BGO96_05445 [Micrococcales bacterium 73-15]
MTDASLAGTPSPTADAADAPAAAEAPDVDVPEAPRRAGLATRLTVVLLLLLTTGLGWLLDQRPADHGTRPVHGGIGDVLEVGGVLVAVDSVRQVDAVVEPSRWGDPTTYDTAGSWLVVRLAYQGATGPARFGTIQWRDDQGRTFAVDTRIGAGDDEAQPGQWLVSDVVIEVAPGTMGAGEVLVSPRSPVQGVPYRTGVIDVRADEVQHLDAPLELMHSVWVENDA